LSKRQKYKNKVVISMKKLSVNIDVPAIGQCHDFLIPANMAVKDVITLIKNILVSEYGVADSLSDITLFGKDDARALRTECSFSQLGISDGAELILI